MNDTIEPAPPSEEMRMKAQARADLDAILSLRKSPAWAGYFLRRLREKIAPLEDAILNKPSLDEAKRRDLHTARLTLLAIAALLDEDEQGNRSILGI